MQRYAITDRRLFPGSEADQRDALIALAARLTGVGVEYLQIREKDLPPEELLSLAAAIRDANATSGGRTCVLLNGPADVAEAAGVGLHVPFAKLQRGRRVGSVSCHSVAEIRAARNFTEVLLFAPVFEKRVAGVHVQPGQGLDALAEACAVAGNVPVFALGGVTAANAAACLTAGASGVAGIRMFLR